MGGGQTPQGRGAVGMLDPEIVVVQIGDELAVGGKLGIVAGHHAGVADLHAGSVLRVKSQSAPLVSKRKCWESGAQI